MPARGAVRIAPPIWWAKREALCSAMMGAEKLTRGADRSRRRHALKNPGQRPHEISCLRTRIWPGKALACPKDIDFAEQHAWAEMRKSRTDLPSVDLVERMRRGQRDRLLRELSHPAFTVARQLEGGPELGPAVVQGCGP